MYTELKKLGFDNVNRIVLSLPMNRLLEKRIPRVVRGLKKILQNIGVFYKRYYMSVIYKKTKRIFDKSTVLNFEISDFLSAFVHMCKKNSTLAHEKSSCLSETSE